MSEEKTSLTAALRHLAEQERKTPSEHATPGELTAYHEGTLPSPVEARVREHLAHCKLCSDLLLDLAGFADLAPPPGVPELTDAEVEADWQALRRKLGEGAGRKEEKDSVVPFRPPGPAVAPTPMRRPRDRSRWRYLVAAVIVAAVGLSVWRLGPSEQLAAVHLYQGDTTRGPSDSPRNLVPSRQPIVLHFSPLESHPGYEGKILGVEGNEVWKTSDVKPTSSPSSQDWDVSFEVPGGTLEPGSYRANLYGLDQGRPELLGSFAIEVDDQ